MVDYIKRLIQYAPSVVRSFVNALIGILLLLVQSLDANMHNLDYWLHQMVAGVGAWATNLRVWVGEQYNTLQWIVTVWGPARVLDALNKAKQWASPLLSKVETLARGLVADLRTWAQKAVNGALGLIQSLTGWATKQINSIVDRLARAEKLVFNLLVSPERMALWLAGAMFRALWNYALTNVDRYAAAWWQRRQVIESGTLSIVESILERII